MPRQSMLQQMGGNPIRTTTMGEKMDLAVEIDRLTDEMTAPFESKFAPSDMRQLALVAHNHMKPAMKEFITTYSEILQKFRITGTQTTMRMCKSLWGEEDPKIEYGLTCTSGPLGGDAQIAALMCMEDLGALIFFVDPLSAHPHQADIDSLIRLSNCGNVIVCPNPTSAMSMMHTLKYALEKGSRARIPSFFETLESPAVAEYKRQQELALAAAVAGKTQGKPALATDPSMYISPQEDSEDDDDDDDDDSYEEFLEKLDQHESKVKFAEDQPTGQRPNRASQLFGIAPKEKKKNRVMKKIGKSMKKLGL